MMDISHGLSFCWGALAQLVSGIAISYNTSRSTRDLESSISNYSVPAQPLPNGGKIADGTPACNLIVPAFTHGLILKMARVDRDIAALVSGIPMLALPVVIAFADSPAWIVTVFTVLCLAIYCGIMLIRKSAIKSVGKKVPKPDATTALGSITWFPSVYTWLMVTANLSLAAIMVIPKH